jgi:alanine transaminase
MIKHFCRKFTRPKVLTLESMSPHVKKAEYALRGYVLSKAEEIQHNLELGHKYPFNQLSYLNIGNPQLLGQKPLTWVRQCLSVLMNPDLLLYPNILDIYPPDVIERVQSLLSHVKGGVGAYSESQGLYIVRETIAKFIEKRDGVGKSYPEDIFLCTGASSAAKITLSCVISSDKDGVMIPIPQYPLYQAYITIKNGVAVKYFIDSIDGYWKISLNGMQQALDTARDKGVIVKSIVVINPGNPIGQVLSESNIKQIIEFCDKNKLVIIADEVYQDNIYSPDKKFLSFRKILKELNSDVELISFHSLSKGFYGECGMRGGYMELINIDPEVKAQMLKISSIMLCPPVTGQIAMDLLFNPPGPSQPSYATFIKEKVEILESLRRKAKLAYEIFNSMVNIKCNFVEGAMYAMPCVKFSNKAIQKAQSLGFEVDKFYVLQALEEIGVVLVPGSGFGQKPGTYHFRITLLTPEENFIDLMVKFKIFNEDFHKKYED